MSIRIIKHGLLDTIQDSGRYGYQYLGINPSGAMDTVAAAVANLLTGNGVDDPVLEIHFPAPVIHFEKACLIALSGGDFSACINGENIALDTAILIAENVTLSFSKYQSGARVYLAVEGGFAADKWLGSYSTNTKAIAGGYHGRALKKDDRVNFNPGKSLFTLPQGVSFIATHVAAITAPLYNSTGFIRCMKGNDFEIMKPQSREVFTESVFSISRQSDRMGYQLTGEILENTDQSQRLSSAVTKGSIQLLQNGQLILLMADHQTTGGYPVIAHTISADIPTLAQMQPGGALRFRFVATDETENLYETQQQYLLHLQQGCNLQLQQFFSL